MKQGESVQAAVTVEGGEVFFPSVIEPLQDFVVMGVGGIGFLVRVSLCEVRSNGFGELLDSKRRLLEGAPIFQKIGRDRLGVGEFEVWHRARHFGDVSGAKGGDEIVPEAEEQVGFDQKPAALVG